MISKAQKFKANRKAFYSLIIFSVICLISFCADFISNDKPLLVKYQGEYYFPIFKKYTEQNFGGDFLTEADYQDPYVQKLIKADGFMLNTPLNYSFDSINYHLTTPPPSPPTKQNILGTDDQARDVFARLLYGLRISLIFGFLLTVCSSVIGIFLGALQGYYGGKFDLIMQRFIEIWANLPMLFILIIMASFITPNFWWLLFIMILFSWNALVAPVRAEFLKARNLEYVIAARAMGVSELNIILKHILPNALIATFTFLPFILSGSIVSLTALDFLGFGMPAGSASLGELLAQGKNNPHALWLSISSFITLTTILTLVIFIGEGIRDSFREHP